MIRIIGNIMRSRAMYKKVKEDPARAAADELSGLVSGIAAPFLFFGGAALLLLFLAGFTDIFGKSFIAAAAAFFILLVPYAVFVFLVRRVKALAEKSVRAADEALRRGPRAGAPLRARGSREKGEHTV